jgi:hypothetical protein
MSKSLIFLSLILFLGTKISYAQNYNKIMGKAIKKSIGNDLKGYLPFSYPTDNFGLITSYDESAVDENFICDMWSCIGVDTAKSNSATWLDMNKFAAVGAGGSITLSEKDQKNLAIGALLPKIFSIIGVNTRVNNDRTTQLSINIGKAYLRKLRRQPMIDYINQLDKSSLLYKSFSNGTLVLVVADCVIEDLSVEVKIDKQHSSALDAKIGAIPGSTVASKVFSDVSLTVAVTRNLSGTYTFKINHPVIYARLAKKQPLSQPLEGNDDTFDDWTIVKKPLSVSPAKS